ncbi:MAG: PEP-CTERM sorting domain-containing protein [Thermoguttaceae bacterium]
MIAKMFYRTIFLSLTIFLLAVISPVRGDIISLGTIDNFGNSQWSINYLGYGSNTGQSYTDTVNAFSTNHEAAAQDLYSVYQNVVANPTSYLNSQLELKIYENNEWPMARDDNMPGWHTPDDNFRWIGAADGGLVGNDVGYYAYVLDFLVDVPADTILGWIVGSLAVDNDLFGVFLNGNLISGFSDIGKDDKQFGTTAFPEPVYLENGQNQIVFLVGNSPKDWGLPGYDDNALFDGNNNLNPTGFYSALAFTTENPNVTPEPATMLVFGVGIVLGLPWMRRRTNRK